MRQSAALRWACPTAAAFAGLALIAGCGGGSTGLNTAQVIAKGDAICQEGQKRFSEIQAARATTAKVAADQTAKLIEAANAEIGQLKQLRPPADLKPKLDAYIAAREQVLTYFHQGLDAAKHNQDQDFAAAKTKIAEGGPGRLKLAEAVGFKKCSQPTAGLPGGSSGGPSTVLLFVVAIAAVVLYMFASYLVASYARRKGRSFLGYLLLGIFVSPLIALIVALIVEDRRTPRRVVVVQDGGSGDHLDRLKKLAELRDAGTLSADEFEAEKARILAERGS